MRKITLVGIVLILAFGFTSAQKDKPTIKEVNVNSEAISKQPARKAYVVDLTRKGTVYNLAPGVDYSKVTVRTAKGDTTFAQLLKDSKVDPGSRAFTVGAPADLRWHKLPVATGGGSANFTCSGLFCGCKGDDDCNKMFSGTACGPIAWCTGDSCYCVARP